MSYILVGAVIESGTAFLIREGEEGVWCSEPPYSDARPVGDLEDSVDLRDVVDWRRPLASLADIPAAIAELQQDLASGMPDVVVNDIYGGVDVSLAESMIHRLESEYLPACRYTDVVEICGDLLKVPAVQDRPDVVRKIQSIGKAAETALFAIGGAAAHERFPR